MEALAERIILLSGWRRLLVAVFAGAVAALSMPPLGVLLALGLALPVAVWLIDGATEGPGRFSLRTLLSAFKAGWAFGFGYFITGLWWIGAAFTVETDEFFWLMPVGVIGMPLGLGLIHGLGFLLARLLWSGGAGRIFAFATAMGLIEWLRGFVLTGFPWNSLGQALGAFDATAQIASVVGLNGMTMLVLMIFASFATLGSQDSFHARWRLPICAIVALAGIVSFGFWRLHVTEIAMVPDVKIRIMQPNISQREKHRLSGQEVLSRYLALSDRGSKPDAAGLKDVTHLVWPESPFPFLLSREPQALAQIAAALKPSATLITGAVRAEDAGARPRYFNSMHVVGSDGVIADSYDKTHLVPFGEYLPLRDLFDRLGIRQFVEVPGGFEAGARRRLLSVKGLPPVWPLICYEAVFPFEAEQGVQRAGVIINVTNDAWFGVTPGPHQHLAQSRIRSIEQGLPLVRAANTGISALVDPLGRITARLPLAVDGVLDGPLPKAIAATFYARFGDLSLILLLFINFMLFIRLRFH